MFTGFNCSKEVIETTQNIRLLFDKVQCPGPETVKNTLQVMCDLDVADPPTVTHTSSLQTAWQQKLQMQQTMFPIAKQAVWTVMKDKTQRQRAKSRDQMEQSSPDTAATVRSSQRKARTPCTMNGSNCASLPRRVPMPAQRVACQPPSRQTRRSSARQNGKCLP
jgi:hypothetical protein